MNLFDIPNKLISYKMCLEEVKKNGMVLQFVPQHLITQKLCLEAIKQSSRAFQFVPEKFKTLEMYLYKNKINNVIQENESSMDIIDIITPIAIIESIRLIPPTLFESAVNCIQGTLSLVGGFFDDF